MPPMNLDPVEENLCRKVAHGEPVVLAPGEVVDAEVIRHILLGLPLIKKATPLWCDMVDPAGPACDGLVCPKTAVGISIHGGAIRGRLKLDSASGDAGGPLCPLHFEKVLFNGGFSGADGYFNHLSFSKCTFQDAKDGDLILPSIDLSNARIESDLDLSETSPHELSLPASPPGWTGEPTWREEGVADNVPHHWIKLMGARVAGMVNLSASYLRAPAGAAEAGGRPDALNMSLIEASGDFHFGRGSCAAGSIWAKNAHFKGDFWLSGARLDGRGAQSLMLQSAAIDGMLVIDSRFDDQSYSSPFRHFSAHGEMNLHALRLGGKLFIKHVTVTPSRDARPSSAPRPGLAGSGVGGDAPFVGLCLSGARMPALLITGEAGMPSRILGLIQLEGLEVGGSVTIGHLRLGRAGRPSDPPIFSARELRAGVVKMTDVKPAEEDMRSRLLRPLSLDLSDADLGELRLRDCDLNGRLTAASLTVRGDVILGVSAVNEVDLSALTAGGSLDLSALKIRSAQPDGARLVLRGAQIERTLRLAVDRLDSKTSAFEVTPAQASRRPAAPNVDLSDVSCRMLDDQGGRLWGSALIIKMDRLVYGAATWEESGARETPPVLRLKNWFQGKQAEWLLPECLVSRRKRAELRGRRDYWAPWQVRRNWIYQQFPKARRRLSPSRHRIQESEYRPQPFDQAIRAARSEGREDIAIHFEILKRRIEWDLFNSTSRWWLGGIGIVFACLWLLQQARWQPILPVGTVLIAMTVVAWLWAWNKLTLGPCRMALIPLVLLWGFALVAFFWGGWDSQPLIFLAAILIFGSVRLLSWLSNLGMRWMFGYLRRPVRAIGTFIAAFAVGWLGVYAAESHGMMIVDAAPVAVAAAEASGEGSVRLRMVSPNMAGERGFIHNVRCGEAISAPLYALDVLIPLIDLRQESRCEPGRAHDAPRIDFPPPEPHHAGASLWSRACAAWTLASRQLRALVYQERFWAVMKALYAIAGWFIVSLSILTFANVHRAPSAAP